MSIVKVITSIFTKNKTSVAKKELSENPYLNAQTLWNDRTSALVSSHQHYQLMALMSLLITLAAVGGTIYIGSQSKFIPLIVREDAQHNMMSVTRADHIERAAIEDYRIQAENFIENVRLVTPHIELQRRAVFRAYAALAPNDPAILKANDYLKSESPFERAAYVTVNTEMKSSVQATHDSWQLDWLETIRDRKGVIIDQYMMRALMTLYQKEPNQHTTEEDVRNNPRFIYIQDFNWSKLQREVK